MTEATQKKKAEGGGEEGEKRRRWNLVSCQNGWAKTHWGIYWRVTELGVGLRTDSDSNHWKDLDLDIWTELNCLGHRSQD